MKKKKTNYIKVKEIQKSKLDINWESFKEISGKFVKLLDCDEIRESILTGMIVGIGGTTQSFVSFVFI